MTHLHSNELGDQKAALHVSIINRAPLANFHELVVEALCEAGHGSLPRPKRR